MEARELRIGNIVNTPVFASQLATSLQMMPTAINSVHLRDAEHYNGRWAGEAIPLTPEILEKCGFKKHKNSNEYWNHWVLENGWHISECLTDESPGGFEEKGVCYWSDEFIPCKYLHQLQNLYFALTGTELSINL